MEVHMEYFHGFGSVTAIREFIAALKGVISVNVRYQHLKRFRKRRGGKDAGVAKPNVS